MNSRAELPLVTRSRLADDFRALGVRAGSVLMLHASLRSVGWVVGGPDVVLAALADVLGPDGTLCMYVGWEDNTYEMDSWSPDRQRAYLEERPAFDARTSRAALEWGVLPERLRTTAGAHRSNHPEASVAAFGARAEWLTRDHPLQYGFGPGTPFERIVQARGEVLLLGSPRGAVTLLHYAEHLSQIPDKRVARYHVPLIVDGDRRWVDVEELDTVEGIKPWRHEPYGNDYFAAIVDAYLARGHGRSGLVGAASSHLFDAADLTDFAARWMERNLVEQHQLRSVLAAEPRGAVEAVAAGGADLPA
jgi:aminoglycoside 3-N-acetyltransferase